MVVGVPVKLRANCPRRYLSEDSERVECSPSCCELRARAQPPLCTTLDHETEAYRLHVDPSFDPGCVIRIGRSERSAVMTAKRWWQGPPVDRELTDPEWRRFLQVFAESGFWFANPDRELMGFDGTTWTLEVRQGLLYHAISRWGWPDELSGIVSVMTQLAGYEDEVLVSG